MILIRSIFSFCYLPIFLSGFWIQCKPQSTDYSFLSYLGVATGGTYQNGVYLPSENPFEAGSPAFLNGEGAESIGIVVSAGGGDSTLGISTSGNGIPDLIFLFDSNGIPFAVDTNGNGIADYYICYQTQNNYTLMTGQGCTGNSVTVFPGQGYDTNGDGIADNLILSQIAADSLAPSSVISPNPGIYGSNLNVTIACNDNVAPGNIVYTTDLSTPSLVPVHGTVSNPFHKTVLLSGDGLYTIKYRCRDLSGNTEAVHTDTYEINHNVPVVTISNLNSTSVSSQTGAVNSLSFHWASDHSGTYSIRLNANHCQSGTVLQTGTMAANSPTAFSLLANTLNFGVNQIHICATAALTGSQVLTIVRDESQPSVSPSPGGGNYGIAQNVSLSCIDNNPSGCGVIAYTLDGSNPSIDSGSVLSGTRFQNPISIPLDTAVVLKFIGVDLAGNLSPLQSVNYFINSQVATVTTNSFAPASRLVNASTDQSVSWVSDANGVFTIRSGASCESGTIVSGSNTAGNVTAGVAVTSTILNASFVAGANTLWICVANASLDPLFGSTSFTITKDNSRPSVSATNPANFSVTAPVWNAPDPARIQIVFNKNMNSSFGGIASGQKITNRCFPAPVAPAVSALSVLVYDGVSWDCIDFTATYTWTSSTTLQIDLSWIVFPENARILWTLSKSVLQDTAGNSPLLDIQQSFLTGTRSQFYKPFQTEQLSCWDGNGNLIPCTGTAHDGQSQTGEVRSYQIEYIAGDAITHDVKSGLDWKTCVEGKKSFLNGAVTSCVDITTPIPAGSCSPTDAANVPVKLEYWPFFSFEDSDNKVLPSAVNGCSYLNQCNSGIGYGGKTDWRLPTQKELETLSVFGSSSGNPSFPSSGFPDSIANYYWSSTLRRSNAFYAWGLNFNYGASDVYVRSNPNQIRCVSGLGLSSVAQSLSDPGNQTIVDSSSNLVWQKCSAGLSGASCASGTATRPNWVTALSYCDSLNFAGKSNWRLPNIKELNSIVDLTSSSSTLSIHPSLFPNTKNSFYWTSSSFAPSPGNAWSVFFQSGGMTPFSAKSSTAYVRCVAEGP
ncbi:DUF1566 domain-containing protein [Leptospira sp. WS92.C1]